MTNGRINQVTIPQGTQRDNYVDKGQGASADCRGGRQVCFRKIAEDILGTFVSRLL